MLNDDCTTLKKDFNEGIETITGNKILYWTQSAFYDTSADTVNISAPTAASAWRYIVQSCSVGDTFCISGKGGTNPRLWAFIDASGNVLTRDNINFLIQEKVIITAPANSAYLICNDSSFTTIRSVYNIPLIDTVKDNAINISNNHNSIEHLAVYNASIKKPTAFINKQESGVRFYFDKYGNATIVGSPTTSMVWVSESFLQKEDAKAILTGKPSGMGSKYWIRLAESSDGENFSLISGTNVWNSNDSQLDIYEGKYYRLTFGITNDAIGSTLDLSFKPILYTGGYIIENTLDNEEESSITNIIIPAYVDTMEGHENNIYFDALSANENMESLYFIKGITNGMYRNQYCTKFTPTSDMETWSIRIAVVDKNTAIEKESKQVFFNVNHKLQSNLTKNVLIMGDSLTDADIIPQECYRMLTEDGDCTINRLGTLGSAGSENEGRSSWRWRDYVSPSGTYQTNYTNPFWDDVNNRLDFKKYCTTNGYSGIDYVLINLGTNDALNSDTIHSPEDYSEVINTAKTFLTALLSSDYGYPDCKIAIALLGIGPEYSARIYENAYVFRKKFNYLNVAYINAFDNGAWNPKVTCFALGSSVNRKYGYGYTEAPISSRFQQLTIQEDDAGIHPSIDGYKSWADAYYCKIRTWLTEDSQ